MTTVEAASGARDGGGGGGDAATAPSSFEMQDASAVVARIFQKQQQQQQQTADEDTDDDAAMDEFLLPKPPSPSENEDAPTTAEVAEGVPPLTIAQPADAEEACENSDEGPMQEEPMDTPSTSQEAALVKVTVAGTESTGDSRVKENEASASPEAKRSWAGAIPNIMQKLQEKKAELVDALAIPRCHPCAENGKRTSADQRCLDADCRIRNVAVCSSCFDKSHKTQEERRHRQSVMSNCPQCQMERVVFYCADCDLSFCTPCFDAIHSLPKVQEHRKFPMEGVSGSMLSKANGAKKFQLSIAEMLAAGAAAVTTARTELREAQNTVLEQHKAIASSATTSSSATVSSSLSSSSTALQKNESTASTAPPENQKELQAASEAREKRKRELTNIDIILVDSDSDSESDEASPVTVSAGLHNLGIRQVVSSSAYETENSSTFNDVDSDMNEVMQSPPVTEPITTSYMPPAAFPVPVTTVMPPVQSMDGWDYFDTNDTVGGVSPATNGMGPGGVGIHASMSGMPFGNGGGGINGLVMDNGNGNDIPYMGMPSIPAMSTATSNNLVTAAPSNWMANPLEDILYDRYYQINLYTVNMEQNIMLLNARIVQVSTQNLQAAQQLAVTLKQQQSMMLKAQANRRAALVALIVQSHGIMRKVKRLRMDTLCDIPQVATASHKKCVELSQQIAVYANNVATLHQQMAMTLDSANAMNPNAFHQNVSTINQSIQLKEQSIAGWKEERENEIMRIVQYTTAVREELKRAFHQQKPLSGASSSSSGPQQQQQSWQRQQSHPHQHNGYHR
ncbi:hypothetical protein Gpo141_00006808 [Globisporangium polare]